MQASPQVPDAHNPDDLSSDTDDNTELKLDAKPVTKAEYEKQWVSSTITL